MRFRNVLFWTHLVSGVVAGSIILTMSVTGIILAFEDQIVEWVERDVRRVAPQGQPSSRLDPDALLARAKAARPDRTPTGVTLRADPSASAVVHFGREEALFLNPYNGTILGGESKTHAVMHQIVEFHRWLGNRDIGRPITGACNLAFFVLVATGFYLWWPRSWTWSKLRTVVLIKPHLSGKARDWNWHNAIGFWSAPALIVITFSGLVISYPWANDLVYRITGNEAPPARVRVAAGGRQNAPAEPAAPLGSLAASVTERTPDWISLTIRFPRDEKAPATATVEQVDRWHPAPRSQFSLDAATGRVLTSESYRDANAGRKARIWLRYLHTGEAGGIAGQFIALLASAGATVLVWTGMAMAWRRFRGRKTAPFDARQRLHPKTGTVRSEAEAITSHK